MFVVITTTPSLLWLCRVTVCLSIQ